MADALIVVDMQIAFVYGPNAVPGGTELAERIEQLLGRAGGR
jgi:streptothricin hydrolase